MSQPQNELLEILNLEQIELDLYRGLTPARQGQRIYGGQVVAQALTAAYRTIEGRLCHSMHAYFIRPGDPSIPILFQVDRARDGGSFSVRRVTAIQNGKQIFNLAASFQVVEDGFDHQAPMPKVPGPDELPTEAESMNKVAEKMPPEMRKMMSRPRPIEMRGRDAFGFGGNTKPTEGKSDVWIRATGAIGDDPRMHQVILAYASDMNLLSTAMRPHGVVWQTPGLQSASLDHAMWFHKPSNFNDWHLYTQDSPSASGGRGFVRGSLYTQDGTLVASVAQEGLMRMRKGD